MLWSGYLSLIFLKETQSRNLVYYYLFRKQVKYARGTRNKEEKEASIAKLAPIIHGWCQLLWTLLQDCLWHRRKKEKDCASSEKSPMVITGSMRYRCTCLQSEPCRGIGQRCSYKREVSWNALKSQAWILKLGKGECWASQGHLASVSGGSNWLCQKTPTFFIGV